MIRHTYLRWFKWVICGEMYREEKHASLVRTVGLWENKTNRIQVTSIEMTRDLYHEYFSSLYYLGGKV